MVKMPFGRRHESGGKEREASDATKNAYVMDRFQIDPDEQLANYLVGDGRMKNSDDLMDELTKLRPEMGLEGRRALVGTIEKMRKAKAEQVQGGDRPLS